MPLLWEGAVMMKATRILIVDDHPLVREALKLILEDGSGMVIADEAGTKAEALQKICENDYDVVLLDLRMPDSGGLEGLKEIKMQRPSLPVLVISVYPEEDYGVRALKAGASGYVNKREMVNELTMAIRTVLSGKKYIGPTMAEKLALSLNEILDKKPHESLSDRELEVMLLIASGKRLKEIADKLSLSIKTVSTYRTRILEKMNLESNAQLIRYALQNRLID